MLATIAELGETGSYTWRDNWADLVKNDVLVVGGWEDAYYSAFSGGSGKGDRPLVVSYPTSPVAEAVYAETPITVAPTGIVAEGAFRRAEFAGVLPGAKNPEAARRFVAFLLSARFQEDMPLQMFVYPAGTQATLPRSSPPPPPSLSALLPSTRHGPAPTATVGSRSGPPSC